MRGDGSIVEHIGSYTELLEKIKILPQTDDKKNRSIKKEQHEKQKYINKLSYKDKRLLEVLPVEIKDLEEKIYQIENILANDTELYIRDASKFDELTLKLEDCKQQKEEKETLWLEIEIMAESFN